MQDFTTQSPPITGYRKLSEAEVIMINRIKAVGDCIEALIVEVQHDLLAQASKARVGFEHAEMARIEQAQPARWMSIARTDFQTALMALVRAVAQPSNF